MLKYALLAGAMTLSVPAFAQNVPGQQSAPQTSQSAPATTDQTVQDQGASTATPAADAASAQGPATAAAEPVPATQVADVVSKEFATYDTDGNGTLNAKEFGAWMVALKTASDPATKAESKATKTWIGQAFAQADKDKSKSVSKTELTGFLGQQG